MNRNSSDWGTFTIQDVIQDSASDGQQEQDIPKPHFPVSVREDGQSSPPILRNIGRRDSGQQPTIRTGTSNGPFASRIQSGTQWDNVAAQPSSPIDIHAVDEEDVADFTETPWTIARRLARTNRRKASSGNAGFGPKFAHKFRPTDAPKSARIKLQPPSNKHRHRASGKTPLPDRSILHSAGKSDPVPKTWPHQDQPDFPSPHQEEVMSADSHRADPALRAMTPLMALSPETLPQSTSDMHHRLRGKRLLYPTPPDRRTQGRLQIRRFPALSEKNCSFSGFVDEEHFEGQRKASPPWPTSDRSDPALLPVSSHSRNGSEYTGIENTTSAIDQFPSFASSFPRNERIASDTFGNYFEKIDSRHEPNYEPEFYEEDEGMLDTCGYGSASNSLGETQELDGEGYDDESNDYFYPAEAIQGPGRPFTQGGWDHGQSSYDFHVSKRSRIDPGGTGPYSEGGSTGAANPSEDQWSGKNWRQGTTGLRQRRSSQVGRLSGYTKSRRTPYRAPPYARGSSSSRIPPEVYRYKASGARSKQSFHDAISSFKFKTSRSHTHPHRQQPKTSKAHTHPHHEHSKAPPKSLKLSCLYEPAGTGLGGKGDARRREDEGGQLLIPALRSRAMKPSSLKTSEPPQLTPSPRTGPNLNSGPLSQKRRIDKKREPRLAENHVQHGAGHRQRSRSRSESATIIRPQSTSQARLPPRGPTLHEVGPSRLAHTEPQGWPSDGESSGSESIEIVKPADRITSPCGVVSRQKKDRLRGISPTRQGRTKSRERPTAITRDPPFGAVSSTSPDPFPSPNLPHTSTSEPSLPMPKPPKTVILKYNFNSLSVQYCRALREVLEEQVGRRRVWSD
ncbi:hypothetical protein PCANC_26788 [Puccinia coronata f. sp. avenae]|uniref:Uncharacterized protein n=1 Tax=Puccinia coronata f. sp. avenae TaxID=200324 RepID=A0A2N5S2H9_9BASI|nr:hypothetical protein PCANC_26788 [Puccinia coronata f. sp. avenae]